MNTNKSDKSVENGVGSSVDFWFMYSFFSLPFFQEERRRLKNAIIIQSFVRGYRDRKHQVSIHLFIEKDAKQFCCKTGFLEKKNPLRDLWFLSILWPNRTQVFLFISSNEPHLLSRWMQSTSMTADFSGIAYCCFVFTVCMKTLTHLQPSHASEALCVCVCVCEAKVVAWVKRFFLLGWLFCWVDYSV